MVGCNLKATIGRINNDDVLQYHVIIIGAGHPHGR